MFSKTSVNRWVFIFSSLFIISLIVWNTYTFFNRLKENERIKMELWATAQEELQENLKGDEDLSSIIPEILSKNTTTPMILYSHRDTFYDSRNLLVEETDSVLIQRNLAKIAAGFNTENTPLEVTYKEEILQTIYYGNSPTINKLKYYPAILILILFLFIAALYFFYKTSKSSEQNKLWAGMAKETAHQIGTPLSSLVGWAEILKTENVNPEYITEIEKDITRLKTITERFSKVGSKPKLEKTDIVLETKNAFEYLKSRSSKLIDFTIEAPNDAIFVALNPQLFGWTVENLVKNGIDAMKGKGVINVTVSGNSKYAVIQVADSGKGISKRNFKKVFTPGFTTKKRGWGLGLSLAKRIIEEYHNGKIKVLKSAPEKGTTMEILLKKTV